LKKRKLLVIEKLDENKRVKKEERSNESEEIS